MGKKQTAYTPSILPVLIKLYFLPIKEQLTVHIVWILIPGSELEISGQYI